MVQRTRVGLLAAAIGLLLIALPAAPHLAAENPLSLREVKSVYVDAMGNDLDKAITQELVKWEAIKLVSDREQADGVLIGATGERVMRSLTRLEGKVTLVDRRSNKPIWSTKASTSLGAVHLAEVIVKRLKKDYEKASNNRDN